VIQRRVEVDFSHRDMFIQSVFKINCSWVLSEREKEKAEEKRKKKTIESLTVFE